MRKSMKPLRQVNLFSGLPERQRKVKPKVKVKSITKAVYEKKVKTKNLVRNFFENQLMLPVITVVNSIFGTEKPLPLLPDKFLEKGFPDLVTKHRAFRVSDSINDALDVEATRRTVFRQTWSDHHIICIHSELLYESLTVLTYDGVPEEKIDVIEWIFAEDELLWHGRRVKAEHIPFSFKACCMLCRFDYTVLQDFIYSKLTNEYKQLINYEMAA